MYSLRRGRGDDNTCRTASGRRRSPTFRACSWCRGRSRGCGRLASPRGAVARHAFIPRSPTTTVTSSCTRRRATTRGRARPYPALDLLHGLGDDAERWLTGGGAADNILDNLIDERERPFQWWSCRRLVTVRRGARPAVREAENIIGYEKSLLNEVIPTVERGVSREQEPRTARDCGLVDGRRRVALRRPERVSTGSRGSAPSVRRRCCGRLAAGGDHSTSGARGRGPRRRLGRSPCDDGRDVRKDVPGALRRKTTRVVKMLWIVCGTADGSSASTVSSRTGSRSRNISIHRTGGPRHGARLAAVAPECRGHGSEAVPMTSFTAAWPA